MAAIKTHATDEPLDAFLERFAPNERARQDSYTVTSMMERATGAKPIVWSNNMVGFGTYEYKSERSSQAGTWPVVAFSPRKSALTLYILLYGQDQDEALSRLGKHKRGAGCLYVNKLADIDLDVLQELIDTAVSHMRAHYTTNM